MLRWNPGGGGGLKSPEGILMGAADLTGWNVLPAASSRLSAGLQLPSAVRLRGFTYRLITKV